MNSPAKTTPFLPLLIQDEPLKVMAEHASYTFPDECCGFMYGEETHDSRIITRAIQVCNVKEGDKRRRFEISPLSYIKAEQYAVRHGLKLLGVYHSHPQHPAIPSEHDLKQAVPYFSYIIVSVQDGFPDHIRSWRLNDAGVFEEEEILERSE